MKNMKKLLGLLPLLLLASCKMNTLYNSKHIELNATDRVYIVFDGLNGLTYTGLDYLEYTDKLLLLVDNEPPTRYVFYQLDVICGWEINQDYVDIANARIQHYKEN